MRAVFATAFGILLLACASASSAQTGSSSTDSDRWAIRSPERHNGSNYLHAVAETRCGSLQHFLKRETTQDTVTSEAVGSINGFVIYDVFHIDELKTVGPLGHKMILVERKRGEFCEIFVDPGETVRSFEPSYFVSVDSQIVLASRDPIYGTGGYFNDGFWTFDKNGPIFLDVWNVIDAALNSVVPPGFGPWHGEGFDIQTLTYSYRFNDNKSRYGNLHLAFALKDHKLVLVSHEFDEGG